jgi:hypothetical protein
MVWHILKKDWKLMGRMAAGAALLYAMRVVFSLRVEPRMGRMTPAFDLQYVLSTLSLIAEVLVVALVVQKDAIAGLRQDWLVRPVKRTDLLLSKLAFVVLLVQGPVLVLDVVEGLAAGIGPGAVLAASVWRSVWMLGTLLLPVFAFATLTRNLMEAVGAGLAVTLVFAMFQSATMNTGASLLASSGIGWILSSMQTAWLLAGVAAILGLQYYRRKVAAARWVGGLAIAAAVAMQFVPWQQAFAIQAKLSSKPSAANGIQVRFDKGVRNMRMYGAEDDRITVAIPFVFEGVGLGERLIEDRVSARVIEANGKVTSLNREWEGRSIGFSGNFEAGLLMTKDLVGRLKRGPARLELELYLTLAQAGEEARMAAEGSALIDGIGRCAAWKDFVASEVEVNCRVPGKAPCAYWELEDTTGRAFVRRFSCTSDYAPRLMGVGNGAIRWSHQGLPFEFGPKIGDPLAEAADEQKLKGAQVMVQVYRAVDHFTRQVVIPDFLLNDAR